MAISLGALVPELQPWAQALHDLAGSVGIQPRVTSTRRSYEEQKQLYDRYLRGLQRFPVAPPGTSAHETGEAFDMLVTPVEYLVDLGRVWKSWGGVWGGHKDPVHFQLPGAPSPELLAQTTSARAAEAKPLSVWDYIGWSLDATSLVSLLLELGYVATSETEAVKIAKALHVDPHGRVF